MPIKDVLLMVLFHVTQSYLLFFFVFRWASDNDFTGQIPEYIGRWANLTDL
jgi:hypothetical protein